MNMMNLNTTGKSDYHPSQGLIAPEDDDDTLRHISEAVHRVNEAVLRAVHTGVSVELVRTSRCHDERGNWGDQLAATIRN